MTTAVASELHAMLEDFRQRHPAQADIADAFAELLRDREDPFSRERQAGHFTGSAFLVDRAGTRVLLTHHRKLDCWLQLGGHADGDCDLAAVALREAEEESGLVGLAIEPMLFDIDVHEIPARVDVPGHLHFDARFVVRAGHEENFVVSDESHALAWWPIRDLVGDARIDASLQRMAKRYLGIE